MPGVLSTNTGLPGSMGLDALMLGVGKAPSKAHSRKRSRAGDETPVSGAESCEAVGDDAAWLCVSINGSMPYTPDGRKCHLCELRDNTLDPVRVLHVVGCTFSI